MPAIPDTDVDPTERYPIRASNEFIPPLVADGPQHMDRSPNISTRTNVTELRRCLLNTGRDVSHRHRPIWYLEDLHSPEEIVIAYLEANDGLLDELTVHTGSYMFGQHSDELQTAWKRIASVYGVDNPQGEQEPNDGSLHNNCPFCEQNITSVKGHIDDCPDAPTAP